MAKGIPSRRRQISTTAAASSAAVTEKRGETAWAPRCTSRQPGPETRRSYRHGASTLAGSNPPGLVDRGFHILNGKSAAVQVFGLDQ